LFSFAALPGEFLRLEGAATSASSLIGDDSGLPWTGAVLLCAATSVFARALEGGEAVEDRRLARVVDGIARRSDAQVCDAP
jgi:hypothetical protein